MTHHNLSILSIAQTLIALSSKKSLRYCYPSQETLLLLLRKYHQVEISRRTLNRHLKIMEDLGLIERRRRITKGPHGRPLFNSTLYILRKRIFKIAAGFMKAIKKAFTPHFPTHPQIDRDDESGYLPLNELKARIRELVASLA